MSLISMAVYSTPENNKDEYLRQTLNSLLKTVDFTKHRIMFSVNGATDKTIALIGQHTNIIEDYFWNDTNLGTAEAINKVWKHRNPGEHVIKIDDDVIIHQAGWADLMEEAISREPLIGIIGLKRKDLIQYPGHPDPNFRSELLMLPHKPYERWIVVERTNDIMGTCTMFNSALLDKVGYSWQPGQYGFEDNLFCHRSHLAGFYNCFLPYIEIEHIDPGGTDYQKWKEKHSSEHWKQYHAIVHEMIEGKRSIYYNPFEK